MNNICRYFGTFRCVYYFFNSPPIPNFAIMAKAMKAMKAAKAPAMKKAMKKAAAAPAAAKGKK